MSKYYPCTGCAVDATTCARRAQIKDAVAGLNVSLVKFICKDRAAFFETGQRVSVELPMYGDIDYNGQRDTAITAFPGTVVRETRRLGRYLVRLDIGDNGDGYRVPEDLNKSGTGFVNVAAQYMTPMDEPLRYVCPICGEIDGKHNGEYFCGLLS